MGAPSWLRIGSYAKYTFVVVDLDFLNGSSIVYSQGASPRGHFEWDALGLNASYVTLQLALSIDSAAAMFRGSAQALNLHAQVNVDLGSRDMYLSRASVGKTFLWIPTDMKEGDTIAMAGRLPNLSYGSVSSTGFVQTSQGDQPTFAVFGTLTSNDTSFMSAFFGVRTGMLLGGEIDASSMKSLGIARISANELYLDGSNVDLGPADVLQQMLPVLVFVALPAAGFFGAFLLYRHQRSHGNIQSKRSR